MLVDPHRHLKGLLDVGDRPVNIYGKAIGKRVRDFQTIGLQVANDPLIVHHRGSELFRELRHRQETSVVRTGRIVDLL